MDTIVSMGWELEHSGMVLQEFGRLLDGRPNEVHGEAKDGLLTI